MNFIQQLNHDWIEMLNFYERPFRAKYIPSKIWKDLDLYRDNYGGFVNYFKKWRTKVQFLPCPARTPKEFVYVAGEYSPYERQCILLVYMDEAYKQEFTDKSWDRFKYKLIQTHMHELIHFMQFTRRADCWANYVVPYKKVGHIKKDAERKYLSNFDEIQAYAHCVYLDYKLFKPRLEVGELLSRHKKKRDSSTLHYYMKTFNYDFLNNSAPQKIIKQIYKWDRKYSNYKHKIT